MMNKKKHSGFSLAEVMVASGLVAVLAVAIMKIVDMQTRAQKKAETDLEITQIVNELHQNLLNEDACRNTLSPLSSILSSPSVPSIRSRSNTVLFSTGSTYRGIKFVSIKVMSPVLSAAVPPSSLRYGELKLQIAIERVAKRIVGVKNILKEIPLKVETNGAGKVQRCYSATENAVDTSKSQSCADIGGIFNAASDLCDLSSYPTSIDQNHSVSTQYLEDWKTSILGPAFVLKAGDTMTGNLNLGTALSLGIDGTVLASSDIKTNTRFCVGAKCRDFSAWGCSVGSVVSKINTDGTVVCSNVSCPPNRFYTGVDSSGNAICKPFPTKTCSANTYLSNVAADGTITCTPLPPNTAVGPCSGTDKLRGITAGGAAICAADVDTTVQKYDCGSGRYLQGFNSAGSAICGTLPTPAPAPVPVPVPTPLPTLVDCSVVVPPSQPPCAIPNKYLQGSSCTYSTYSYGSCTGGRPPSVTCTYNKTTTKLTAGDLKNGSPTISTIVSSGAINATCPSH